MNHRGRSALRPLIPLVLAAACGDDGDDKSTARAADASDTEGTIEVTAVELFSHIPGEPSMVLVAPPGEDSIVAFGATTLAPGRYLVVCSIPTGADVEEFMRQAQDSTGGPPDVPGGPPHFTAGMFAELLVK
jgi:hypothetical protein